MRVREIFDSQTNLVLDDLWAKDAEQRRQQDRGPDSLKALHPSVAQLLHMLILQKQALTIVEFGTSHGVSTIWLAQAARQTGGHVFSVDAVPAKTAAATRNLDAAGLAEFVTLTTAEGADFAESLPEQIDFVLVDFGLPAFLPAYERMRTKLSARATLFVDGGPEGHWLQEPNLSCVKQLEADDRLLLMRLPMHKEHLLAVTLT